MPEAMTYDPTNKTLRDNADAEYIARQRAFNAASLWYDGNIDDTLAIRANGKGKAIDNNVKLNMFAKRVDRRRDFLFKTFPQLDIDDSPEESEDEKWLREAWEWNKAATLWGLSVLNGCFGGQVYMRFMPPREGRDKFPRAILLSNAITYWKADDVDTVLWYELRYQAGGMYYRQDVVDLSLLPEGGRREGWALITYQRKSDAGNWQQSEEELWEYPLSPIISWQHWPRSGRCYGMHEFGDIAINKSVNRIMSLGNKVIHNHAFPKTVLVGAEAKDLTPIAPDEMWSLPSKDAQVFNLEMQSDLSAILTFVDKLDAAYNTQGRTVDVAGGPADFSSITNLAIKVSFMPQEDANEILQRQYGGALVEASKRLQMLDGRDYETDPKVIWKPSLPESKDEVARVVTAEDNLGVASKETQATQLGLDWQKEKARIAKEGSEGIKAPGQNEAPGGVGAFSPSEREGLMQFYQDMKAGRLAPGGNGNGGLPGGMNNAR